MAVSLDDLGTVFGETFDARLKWYYIGLNLSVKASELDVIKKSNPEVKDCYLETLKCWLKGVDPEPTWAALAEALSSSTVDEDCLSEKLREKHCRVLDKSPDVRGKKLLRRKHCAGVHTNAYTIYYTDFHSFLPSRCHFLFSLALYM